MKSISIFVFLLALKLLSNNVNAQNSRIRDYNSIGWFNYFGTFKVSPKISIHTEYQFRRDEFVNNWQQSLLRLGVNYQIHSRVQLRAGYAWIETFAYGDIPINGFGNDFTEHRTYQMLTITDKIGRVDISHRFMQEQRWVGRYSSRELETEDEFPYLHRTRYMLRAQMPIKGKEIASKTPYVALYNEVFIGYGENLGENIFDQNRIGLLIGYRFSPKVRLEAGYLNQIVLLGREIGGRNVLQHNNGIIVNANFDIDFSKRE